MMAATDGSSHQALTPLSARTAVSASATATPKRDPPIVADHEVPEEAQQRDDACSYAHRRLLHAGASPR